MNNYIHYKVWGEITYPFPNFSDATIEGWEWLSNFISHLNGHVILATLGLKLIHVSKRSPWKLVVEKACTVNGDSHQYFKYCYVTNHVPFYWHTKYCLVRFDRIGMAFFWEDSKYNAAETEAKIDHRFVENIDIF